MTREEVEKKLDQIGTNNLFGVRFKTKNGEERFYKGCLVPMSGDKKEYIPIQLEDGKFKSFSVNNVIEIQD